MICRSWLVSQSLSRLIALSVRRGWTRPNANGTITGEVDKHEDKHRDHLLRGGQIATGQVVQREEIGNAGNPSGLSPIRTASP